MADETTKVTALKYHTHRGNAYAEGDAYEVNEADVDNLVAQGMVRRAEVPPPAPVKPSRPVEPMTAENSGLKAKKPK